MDLPRPVPPASHTDQLKVCCDLLNQIFEVEKKLSRIEETDSIERNIGRIKDLFEDGLFGDCGFVFHDPIGESYDETRMDCKASIAGNSAEDLFIVEVIKPIIRVNQGGVNRVVQQGVVIVESKNQSEETNE